MHNQRPPQRRSNKFDRLLSPSASKDELRCSYACAPFIEAWEVQNLKWGIDRLPGLVDPTLAEKYGRAVAHLNDCMEREAPEDTAAAATNCMKGMVAMDAAATAAGHKPADPETWEIEHDGAVFVFVRDERMWPTVAARELPGTTIYALSEAVAALRRLGPTVDAIKTAFPGATVSAVRQPTPLEADLNDEIPW